MASGHGYLTSNEFLFEIELFPSWSFWFHFPFLLEKEEEEGWRCWPGQGMFFLINFHLELFKKIFWWECCFEIFFKSEKSHIQATRRRFWTHPWPLRAPSIKLLFCRNIFLWHIKSRTRERKRRKMIMWSFLWSSSYHSLKWETNVDNLYGWRRELKGRNQTAKWSVHKAAAARLIYENATKQTAQRISPFRPIRRRCRRRSCVALNVSPLLRINRSRFGWNISHLHHKQLNAEERRRQIPMRANKQRSGVIYDFIRQKRFPAPPTVASYHWFICVLGKISARSFYPNESLFLPPPPPEVFMRPINFSSIQAELSRAPRRGKKVHESRFLRSDKPAALINLGSALIDNLYGKIGSWKFSEQSPLRRRVLINSNRSIDSKALQ